MKMEQKKSSRVHQLRDLFQSGNPRPSEELGDINTKRLLSSASYNKKDVTALKSKQNIMQKHVKEESISELDSGSLKSISDMSDPDILYTSNDIPCSVRKASSSSDSDIDSPRSDQHDKEVGQITPPVFKSNRNDLNNFNASTLYPILPFPGNQPTKIRPLGEEFRIRIISRNPLSSTKNSEQRTVADHPQEITSPSLNSPSPSNDISSQSPINNIENAQVDKASNVVRQFLEPQSIFSNETVTNKKRCDSDIDEPDMPKISQQKCSDKPADMVDGHLDALLVNKMKRPGHIKIKDKNGMDLSSNGDSINKILQFTAPISREMESTDDRDPEFQDFLLEPSNFQFESPMQAESVELDERTTSEDDYGEYDDDDDENNNDYVDDRNYIDCDNVSAILDSNLDDTSPMSNVVSFEMICPKQKEVVSIKSGCHILEDGHFFYERMIDIDSDTESELESQNILTNNHIVKTFKRPGATVHFNLNKIRIYSTHIAGEYNRKNEEIDPLSSAAEYEMEKRLEKMNIFPVDLFKGSSGLGISILGMGVGHSSGVQKLGIFVKSITEGGAAEQDGRIKVYDQLVEVNKQSLVSVSQEFAASVLRNTHGVVNFLIGREIDQTNSEIVRLVDKSRHNSGIVSEPFPLSPASGADTESGDLKTQNNLNLKETNQQESERTKPINSPNNFSDIHNSENVNSTNVNGNEESLRCIITDQNRQLNQYRLNEEIMSNKISELQNEIERQNNSKTGLGTLSTKYAMIQSDLQAKLEEIEDLSAENNILKTKLEKTTKKYKEIKRLFKIAEMKYDDRQKKDFSTLYENNVKPLEDQVRSLELQLNARNYNSEHRDYTSDDINTSNLHNEIFNKGQRSAIKKTSISEISNSSRQDPDKVFINLKINLANNNTDVTVDKFSNIGGPQNILDNGLAKNKADLRKTGQMANRKPPTKSMMIGDKSRDRVVSSLKMNKYNSLSDLPSSVEDDASKNINNDSNVEISPSKINGSKMVGGFSLPGKTEIRFGMKPSDIAGSKRNEKNYPPTILQNPYRKSPTIDDNVSLTGSTNLLEKSTLPTNSLNSDSFTHKVSTDSPLSNTSKQIDNNATMTTVYSNGIYKTKL